MDYSSATDEELMVLYQQGNSNALATLYSRHSAKIFGYLILKTSSKELAGDLLQETFLKLHRKREKYSSDFPFLPWIFTIARNSFLDHIKNKETKIAAKSSDEKVDSLQTSQSKIEVNLTDSLQPALHLLANNQKRAIELRYFNDWTFEKIAEELQISPENSRQLISRGLKKIRSYIGRKNDSK